MMLLAMPPMMIMLLLIIVCKTSRICDQTEAYECYGQKSIHQHGNTPKLKYRVVSRHVNFETIERWSEPFNKQ
jgi:hypothetical protein